MLRLVAICLCGVVAHAQWSNYQQPQAQQRAPAQAYSQQNQNPAPQAGYAPAQAQNTAGQGGYQQAQQRAPAQAYSQQAQNPAPPAQAYSQQAQNPAPPAQGYSQQAQNPAPQAQGYSQQAQNPAPQAQGYSQQAQNPAPQASYGAAQAQNPAGQGGYQQSQQRAPAQGYSQQAQNPAPQASYGTAQGQNSAGQGGYGGTGQAPAPGPYVPPPPPAPPVPQESEGQCEYDESEWDVHVQCAIGKAVMFDRKTGLTCEECLQSCLDNRSPNSPWICRAVSYDHRWFICDLFAVSGLEAPYFLTQYPGRDVFVPLGPIGDDEEEATTAAPEESEEATTEAPEDETTEAATTAAPEVEDVCDEPGPDGEEQVARFCRWADRSLPGADDVEVDAADEEECIEACRNNEGGEQCTSFDFGDDGCFLTQEVADSTDPFSLDDSPGTSYFEKICLPADLAEDTEEVWEVVPNFILVGHVQEVTDANDLRECKVQCLEAQDNFGFDCRSAMWYPTDPDQNCLLNSETRGTQPDVFVPEDQGVDMIYFDIGSGLRRSFSRRLRDDVVVDERWTLWSNCTYSHSGYRYRYLKCKAKDVRDCSKQTLRCPYSEMTPLARRLRGQISAQTKAVGACLAVRDLNGNKKCPHGIRTMTNGEREYCRRPVDCP